MGKARESELLSLNGILRMRKLSAVVVLLFRPKDDFEGARGVYPLVIFLSVFHSISDLAISVIRPSIARSDAAANAPVKL